MATTNTNTDLAVLSTDIHEITEFYDQIRANHVPDLDETNSMVGIFGYFEEMFGQTMQSTLIAISELTNEAIPTRAKFTKNVLAHAMNYGISEVNATPSVITLMIYLPVSYIETNFVELDEVSGKAKFILDKEVPIFVGEYEFHLDYDIILTRSKNPQGNYVWTAMYDLFDPGTTIIKQKNPISKINNPYITTLITTTINGVDCVAFSVRCHQVSLIKIEKNILTDNSIENKTFTFDFDDQLATFDIDITENNTTTHITPIYRGLLDYTSDGDYWCYYEYINENTIRVIFDKESYVPGLNAKCNINVQLSKGSSGNFTYNNTFRISLRSEKYNNYNGMYATIYPLLNGVASGGKDKKSVADLRKIIPREASSRGAIINTTDLNNFFNSINDDTCKIYFSKKRDNPFERLYYAHILMRKNGTVYPTNTLNLKISQSDFKGFAGNNNLVISPGTVFYYYDHGSYEDNDFSTVTQPTYEEGLDPDVYPYPMTYNEDGDLVRVFKYISPFLITVDEDLVSSYLMTVMNVNKTFMFDSINIDSDLQFVATNMNWKRNFIYTDDQGVKKFYDYKYTMTIDIAQNDSSDYGLIKYHKDANDNIVYDDVRVKLIMVLYADETSANPYRYTVATLTDYDDFNKLYTFKFDMETDDVMDLNNRINIKGIYNAKPENYQHIDQLPNSHGYMNANTYCKLFILADFGTKVGDEIPGTGHIVQPGEEEIIIYTEDTNGNRDEIESLVPQREDIVDAFLNNEIYLEKDGQLVNVVTIMKANPDYMQHVKDYTGTEEETETVILRYLRNNKDSDFVQNVLLKDEDTIEVIDSYNYEDLSRYTVCNTMTIDGGIDFYHDYSNMMRSTINITQIQEVDSNGNPLYQEVERTDSLGNSYIEYKPIYRTNEDGKYYYEYTIKRIPMIKYGYLNTEDLVQEYIYDLEERRNYINECLYVLEDTFDIDLKFVNTYGPSKTFYYNIPSSTNYKVKVAVKYLNVYSDTSDEDDPSAIIGTLYYNDVVNIIKVRGIWGYIAFNDTYGWIKLSSTTKMVSHIDNVALTMKFALEAVTSADKYIATNIISDIKEYIEDINNITELHIPNVITLITNNYREQLVYFEFLDVNNYGAACQHLYLDETADADICPEFLNIASKDDTINTPEIDITVY